METQKVVLIIGGSRGIGAAEVREFAQNGWYVAFTHCHSPIPAQALQTELPQTLALPCDVTSRASVEDCITAVLARFGEIHAMICNAGIAQQKVFNDITESEWDSMFDTNVKGVYHSIQAILPHMLHRKSGSIVTTSSIWGMKGASCESHYAASKAAVIGLTRSLAQELGPSNIRVNCVAPGVITTDMNACHSQATLNALAEETPLGRLGTAKEVAQAAYFLCSPAASFITGQILGVSGGFAV